MRIIWSLGIVLLSVIFGCSIPNEEDQIRVMTFNIKAGNGNLDEIARAIQNQNPDIIALQEVDVHWSERSDFVDQIDFLSDVLGMHSFFGEIYSFPSDEQNTPPREYGLGILSKEPILYQENHSLTRLSTQSGEQKLKLMPGFPEVVVKFGEIQLHLFNTHLDYRRDPALRTLEVSEMMELIDMEKPVLLIGDLNARPNADELRPLFNILNDAWERKNDHGFTYPSDQPDRRIDYILHSDHFEVLDVFVPPTEASDHRPVVADLIVKKPQ